MWESIVKFIQNIRAEYVALASVLVTILIFVLNRRSELKYKKHEDKKAQYIKVIKLLSVVYDGSLKDKKSGQIKLTDDLKKLFFDVGSSLLLYGSKKLYKEYIFFREFSNNSLLAQSKYYNIEDTIYLVAQLLITIRREVGISSFNSIHLNDSLAFFVNDIANNPIQKNKATKAKYRIKMLKLEMLFIDRTRFVILRRFTYFFIKPVLTLIFLFFKYFILYPLVKLFSKPNNLSNSDGINSDLNKP